MKIKNDKIDFSALREFINDNYGFDYYETNAKLRSGLVYNLATFLFDHHYERTNLKKILPFDIYIKVLEHYVDDT